MGACAMLPRIIGQGRAAELLYTGRVLGGEEAERWGFFNRLASPDTVLAQAQQLAAELAAGPTFANGMSVSSCSWHSISSSSGWPGSSRCG